MFLYPATDKSADKNNAGKNFTVLFCLRPVPASAMGFASGNGVALAHNFIAAG